MIALNRARDLKAQLLGAPGYSTELSLSRDELEFFREAIENQWLENIGIHFPAAAKEFKRAGIDRYHERSHMVVHESLWTKSARVLPQVVVDEIKRFKFAELLREELGPFSISDVVLEDGSVFPGHEEVYWRLVRPDMSTDVGALHTDRWFHRVLGPAEGLFPETVFTVKMWTPIICEPGRNGLLVVPNSHLKEWRVRYQDKNGSKKPSLDEPLGSFEPKLLDTPPGNFVLFGERLLHGGARNQGSTTRVSTEITLVFEKDRLCPSNELTSTTG
jgi:ectoine hydroxylase-related dioxygenase (phytanoyl-CoA dioxygenase family)